MLNTINITIAGNLAGDPELRYTPNGKAAASFTVAVNSRIQRDGEWVDGTPTFVRCEAWNQLAENVAASFERGQRVIVAGRIRTDEWEDKETGKKRTGDKLIVDEIGASVAFATVTIRKVSKHDSDVPPATDPWTGEAATSRAPAGGAR